MSEKLNTSVAIPREKLQVKPKNSLIKKTLRFSMRFGKAVWYLSKDICRTSAIYSSEAFIMLTFFLLPIVSVCTKSGCRHTYLYECVGGGLGIAKNKLKDYFKQLWRDSE